MVEQIDIWRAAAQLVKMYGVDAELMACQKADAAIEAGDPFNERLWRRVASVLRELQTDVPPEGSLCH